MHDFTILIPAGAYASSVALTLDILAAANKLAPRLNVAGPTWQVRSLLPGAVCLSNGLMLAAKPVTRHRHPDRSIWVIPGLATDTLAAVEARLAQEDMRPAIQALKRHRQAGGVVAASCSAVFLLQAAGLLAGRTVTTTWWLAAQLQQREPRCTVDAHRMVIGDGPVWTAGAALAQTDLMMQLLRTRCGAALAEAVSRVLLIDGRQAQSPFIVPAMLASGEPFIAQLAQRIEAALPKQITVAQLAEQLCIAERTLARRVKAASGHSASMLIQLVRTQRARRLLETTRLSVAQVAARVGYQDATALRRLLRKILGVTPRQLRRSTFTHER